MLAIGGTIFLVGSALFFDEITKPLSLEKIQAAKERALSKVIMDEKGNAMISEDSVQSYVLLQNDQYKIVYQKAFDTFYVGIGEPPFDETRREAEAAFLELLEANTRIACQLQVRVTGGPQANPGHAGEQYPLSFCKVE